MLSLFECRLRRVFPTNEIGASCPSKLPFEASSEVETLLANRPLDQSDGGVECAVYI